MLTHLHIYEIVHERKLKANSAENKMDIPNLDAVWPSFFEIKMVGEYFFEK